MTVDTAFLKRLYVFAMMNTSTTQIIHVAVTRHRTAGWLENLLWNALMVIKDCATFTVSDRDGIYGEWLGTFLKDCYDITLYRNPPGMPNRNAFIERWNRQHQSLEQDYPCKNMAKLILIQQRYGVGAWLTG